MLSTSLKPVGADMRVPIGSSLLHLMVYRMCDKLDWICQAGFPGACRWPATGDSDAYCDVFYVCVCVCVSVCEWWSRPCMCDGSLLNSCYLCQLWYLKPWHSSIVTHQWCLQCLPQLCAVAWSDPRIGDVSFWVGLLISWLFLWLWGFINRYA